MKSAQVLPILVVLLAIFCFAPNSAYAQQWTGILDPSRAVDWSNVGVRGGIPNRTTICTTLNPGATAAQIGSAISSCPAGQVVFLSAGTYTLSAGIVFGGKSGVTLRGAGADQTFLVFTNGDGCHGYWADVCMDSADLNWSGGASNSANWTAGYAKGTTNITLSSVTNLKVGFPLILDQVDDASDNGGVFVCQATSTSPPCSLEGNGNAQRPNRDQTQIVQVVSCGTANVAGQACSGTNVTISPALYMSNWNSAKSPGAWWATTPISTAGLENLSIDHTASSGNRGVEISNCIDCWVKGVRGVDSGKAHVEVQLSTRVTIRDSYFYLTQNSVSQSYGAESFTASDMLVENNIFQFVSSPMMINGSCSGCVFSFNYSINNYYTGSAGWSMAAALQHTAGIDNLLYEGNIGSQITGDNFHGTHNLVTNFRNYWIGNQPGCYNGTSSGLSACNNNQIAVYLKAYSRYYNFVGNVLGQSGVITSYQNGSSGNAEIYDFGSGNTEGSVTVPTDPLVATTVMRWGNYDTVTGTTRFVASEVPSAIGAYANPVPSSQTLPPSFYLSAKPNWWPSAKPFPPIGPDVTGGNVSTGAGHVYTIPAQDCFQNVMGGPANGSGSVLSFNPNSCYPTSTVALPVAPTGLQAIVQ